MSSIETLAARQEIADVILRYARGIDRLDFDLVRSCYHPDAYDDHGNIKGDVDTFIAGARKFLQTCDATMHFMGNMLIEIDGDRARAETYAVAYHRFTVADGSGKDDVWGIRYVDRFEQRAGAWKIAYRVVAQEWRRVDPIPAGRVRNFGTGLWGTRDGNDAIDWVMAAQTPAASAAD
jgi:hypothetical protein